ncbi:uncharacterized protein [Solanum lycopersicum]|uniref:uncharacterized protein n=1 Tax=Solanum lycopersicum TaxID=4081 RepID=UPI003747DBE8
MDPFKALYCRRCRSLVWWFEVAESSPLGPKIVCEALENVCVIRHRLKISYSRQKSYANNMRGDLEFHVGDMVYLKISPIKGVMRFGKKGKLSPRYVGLFEVLQRVIKVAYELTLVSELSSIHPIFHISMLKKGISDPISILPIEGLGVDEIFYYDEVAVEILDRHVKKLRNKEVSSVKVL